MRLLGHEAEVASVGRQREVAEVGAVGGHPPGAGVVEAGQQLHDRRLAGARPPDESHRLPRSDGQVDPIEGPLPGPAVAEPDGLETERPGQIAGHRRARRLRCAHRGGQQVGQLHRRRPGLLVGVEDLRQLLDGGEEQVEVQDERDQIGGGERTGPDQPGAVSDHQGGGHLAEELDGREVGGRQAVALQAGVEVLVGYSPELLEVPVLPGEGRHHPGAGQALLQAGHDEGDLVPDAEIGPVGAAPEPDGEHQQRRHDGQGHERQAPVEYE